MDRYSNLAARVRDGDADTTTATPAWISALNACANVHPVLRMLLGMGVYIGLLVYVPWTRTGPYILGLFSIPIAVVALPSLLIVALAMFGVLTLASAPKRVWVMAPAVWWSSMVLASCRFADKPWPLWLAPVELVLLVLTIVFVVRARMLFA